EYKLYEEVVTGLIGLLPWKPYEGEDEAVAEHPQPEASTVPIGTRINYLLLDPFVDIPPAGPLSMGLSPWLLEGAR
ncbi:hypothetical protein KUCAC02_020182, partial [Chaenocephalus aceratus]